MLDPTEYQSLLEDVKSLVRRHAKGKPPRVAFSDHTAAMLNGVSAKGADPLADPAPAPSVPSVPCSPEEGLAEIAGEVAMCQRCPLCETRTNTVPGEGNSRAELVFVGEAPGADEDRQGRPFVGRSGQLLTDIIVKGMQLRREDVFICNVNKCRPPENRTPNPEEVAQCEPFLLRQLELIHPKVICALGAVAAQTLLKTTDSIGALRGRWHNYHGIPCRVTYHPAYLLRKPGEKGKAWEDIQEVMRVMRGEIAPKV